MVTVLDLIKEQKPTRIGEKARNLHWLARHGYRIPQTFVLPFTVHEAYLEDSPQVMDQVAAHLAQILTQEKRYAVRSSANLEDSSYNSYAGQFRTYLNLDSLDEIHKAVLKVWQAAHEESVKTYAQRSGQSLADLKLAVIIQEMITPLISGVTFSKNPLTGLNEIVIEAVIGSGEQLVQEGKTPQRWVYRWGDWVVKPEASEINLELLLQIAQETTAIARLYTSPVDLEWVFDGENLFWVQLRPITRLDDIEIYSNRISREVFPGLIRPLIWSVNVPLVNTVWINLFSAMTGPNELKPGDLAKSFGYRAYFNMGTIGRIFELMGFSRESLEILLGLPGGSEKPGFKPSRKTIRLIPRLLVFALRKLCLGPDVLPALADARKAYEDILQEPLSAFDEPGLLDQIDRLYTVTHKVADYNVIVPLLMSIYNTVLRRQLASMGVDYTHFDLTHDMPELEEYDPNALIRRAASAFNVLDEQVQANIVSITYSEFTALDGIQDFQGKVKDIITRFGHLSDSGNDFSAVPWRETPELVLQMVIAEARRLKAQPAVETVPINTYIDVQQQASKPLTAEKINWQSLPLNPLRRLLLQPVYQRARHFRLYREAVSSSYTYGYGLFRNYFLELGRRFVERGLLDDAGDIFFLCWDEIRQISVGDLESASFKAITAIRKAELEISRNLQLPEIIYGDEIPPLLDLKHTGSDVLTGIPSSRGYYRGPVKVIHGLADFGKLQPGDVLVIPFSDVSWTPLFTRVGAVIAESGGILSHSSIVAREFNLPCVVSVSQACQIPDNTLVSVDGSTGEVVVYGTP